MRKKRHPWDVVLTPDPYALPEGEEWQYNVRRAVRHLRGQELAWDALRVYIERAVGAPPQKNLWGALAGALVSEGLLIETGRVKGSKLPSSHGRQIRYYKVR
jgi:hypothetical protein